MFIPCSKKVSVDIKNSIILFKYVLKLPFHCSLSKFRSQTIVNKTKVLIFAY